MRWTARTWPSCRRRYRYELSIREREEMVQQSGGCVVVVAEAAGGDVTQVCED